MRRPRVATAAALLASALVVAACGDLEAESSDDAGAGELTEGTTTRTVNPNADLPPRPPGVVQLEGQIGGSLTEKVVRRFPAHTDRTGLAIRAEVRDTDEDASFLSLCRGEVDVSVASRRITDAELAACEANGLEVVDYKVAFDAIVIATRNERDVGADCLNLAQVRSVYQTGSPVTSWTQVNPNFFPLRVLAGGPDQGASDFDFFGARVLGVPDPTLANFRADYRAFETEAEIKDFVKDNPPGAVGILGFSFYELFEEFLRPLEIDGQTGDRCVFPSEETISSELYPLERTLRLYTTTRSLRRSEVQEYLRFHLTEAEEIANRLELIPLPDLLRDEELARIDDPTLSTEATAPEDSGEATGDPAAAEPGTGEDAQGAAEGATPEPSAPEQTTTPGQTTPPQTEGD